MFKLGKKSKLAPSQLIAILTYVHTAKRIMNEHRTRLFTRPGCHLCEDAEQILLRHGIVPEPVNIDESPELKEKYGCCIPVVEIDGKVRFRGKVNEMLLRRLLAAVEA